MLILSMTESTADFGRICAQHGCDGLDFDPVQNIGILLDHWMNKLCNIASTLIHMRVRWLILTVSRLCCQGCTSAEGNTNIQSQVLRRI